VRLSDLSEHKTDVLIHPNIKAASVLDVADAIARIMNVKNCRYETIGIRAGEKIHEHLKSDHDSCIRSDSAEKYTMDELIEMITPTINQFLAEG
jgi:FlaA1/EpsC-like NDP-sugar epimerase